MVLAGRRQAPLEALADEARQRGADALAVACDVTDAASVAALFDAIRQRFGRLDLLFNNAGPGAPAGRRSTSSASKTGAPWSTSI